MPAWQSVAGHGVVLGRRHGRLARLLKGPAQVHKGHFDVAVEQQHAAQQQAPARA